MQVAKYTFQSPSTSPVQVGRLDPSSVSKESSGQSFVAAEAKTPTQWMQSNAQKTMKVTPTVTKNSLDTYA